MIQHIFLLSGTPGTGKTSIAKLIQKKYGINLISLTEIVLEHNLYSEEDKERDTKVVDEDKLMMFIDQYIQTHDGDLIVEGHYADLVDSPQLTVGIVLRCHPAELVNRLAKRNYKTKKINENIQAEIVGDCTSYMLEIQELVNANRIFEINSSGKTEAETAEIVYEVFQHPETHLDLIAGQFSWLSDPTVNPEDYPY